MSWAALVLAGTVLAQVPTLPDMPNAPPYAQGNGAAQAPQGGTGAYSNQGTGANNNQGSSLAPLPDWSPSATTPPAPVIGSDPTPAPAQAAPENPAPAAPSPDAKSSMPLWLQRGAYIGDLQKEKLQKEKSQATAPATPQPQPPYSAPQTPKASVQIPAVQNLTPQEMLQQAMTVPPNSVVAGRNVTLLDVLGNVTDRSKRIAITHAYWHLARKLGEYRFCWEESRQIQATRLASVDSNLLAPAQQAADRELTAAELALIQAQYHLAEVAGLDSSGRLPLPADNFHLGTYSTHFDKIFANSSPPGRTRLLHRTLPLQHQVTTVRTEAVHAAQDAFQEIARSYQAGQVDAGDVLNAMRQITAQKRAWITAIARYNDSIADYALAIAGPETTGRDLVSILIKLSKAEPRSAQQKQADLSDAASPTLGRDSGIAAKPGVPTLAPSREEMAARRAVNDANTSAANSLQKPELATTFAEDTTADTQADAIPAMPTLAPPRNETAAAGTSQGVPPVPVDSPDTADLSVTPAIADVPETTAAGPLTDPAVKPAAAEVSVADQTPPSTSTEDQEASEENHPKAAEPTLAQSEETREETADVPAANTQTGLETDTAKAEPTAAAPVAPEASEEEMASQSQETAAESLTTGGLAVQSRPMVTVVEPAGPPRERTVFRQPTQPTVTGQMAWPQANLVGLSEAVQAKKLTAILHGEISQLCPDAQPVDLETCLDSVAGDKRRSVIEAYWEASLRVAEYQVCRARAAFLSELGSAVTLGALGTPDARARLKAAQLDAKANLLEAQSQLLDAQHELTKRCGRPVEEPWLVPKTLPHAGDYRLHLESQPRAIAESWPLKRLAAIIPALNQSLKDRAAAVIKADALRTQALVAYQNRTAPFDRVLSAVDLQATECLEFLNVLATYNQSIADYVTVVVPETLPEEQLVATLVVR